MAYPLYGLNYGNWIQNEIGLKFINDDGSKAIHLNDFTVRLHHIYIKYM